MPAFLDAIDQIRKRILRYRSSRTVNEQDTKAALIQPIIAALGWDVEDLDEVRREFKRNRRDQPVDFALLIGREPALFVEAKGLGSTLDDRRWANQIMSYASVAGVQWVVLTDGDEWRIYNSHAAVPVEEKMLRSATISKPESRPEKVLELLTKSNMQTRQIDRLWEAHFVDRQLQRVLKNLFNAEGGPDPAITRLLGKHLPKVSRPSIVAGLRRLDIRFDVPSLYTNLEIPTVDGRNVALVVTKRTKKSKETKPIRLDLSQLLASGQVRAPLKLFHDYKGTLLESKLTNKATIIFEQQEFDNPSAAAAAARGSVIGGRPHTNGWTFWRFHDGDGRVKCLDDLRRAWTRPPRAE